MVHVYNIECKGCERHIRRLDVLCSISPNLNYRKVCLNEVDIFLNTIMKLTFAQELLVIHSRRSFYFFLVNSSGMAWGHQD